MKRIEKDNKELTFHYFYTGVIIFFQLIGLVVSTFNDFAAYGTSKLYGVLALEVLAIVFMLFLRKSSYRIDPFGWGVNISFQLFVIFVFYVVKLSTDGGSMISFNVLVPIAIIFYYFAKKKVFYRPEESK
jgi:hypothetical protein